MATDSTAPSTRRRIVRLLLIAAGVVVILLLALALIVRTALQPENVRKLVETQLTETLGVPVSVGSFEVSLVPPRVRGSNVTIGSTTPGAAPSVSLKGLDVVPQLKPLLSRRVVIERIGLDGLAITVRRDKDGAWHLPVGGGGGAKADRTPTPATTPVPPATPPGNPPAPAASPAEPAAPALEVRDLELRDGRLAIVDDVLRAPDGGAEVTAITGIAARVRPQDRGIALENLTARLGGSTISGSGTVAKSGLRFTLDWDTLKEEDLPALFGLIGSAPPKGLAIEGSKPLHLELVAAAGEKLDASGTLAADTLRLGPLSLSKVAAPLTLKGDAFALDPIQFTAYSASNTGSVKADLGASPVGWTLVDRLAGLDVNQLLSATTSAKDKLLGTGRVDLNVRGTTAQPFEQQLTGTIDLSLKDGVIKDFPLLATVSRALGIAETAGKDTKFEGFDGKITLASGIARVERLTITMGTLSFNAAGTMRLDNQALALAGIASHTDAQTGKVLQIPVNISGTAASPAFAVDVKKMATTAAKKQLEKTAQKAVEGLAGKLRKKP